MIDFDNATNPDSDATPEDAAPVVSLHAVAGIRTADTMQVLIDINGHQLTNLLDTGSTHNFIKPELVEPLGLALAAPPDIAVMVANGDKVACQGVACDVPLFIGMEAFRGHCYAISLGGYDIVLGVVRGLGPILWDFDDLCRVLARETTNLMARHRFPCRLITDAVVHMAT